MSNADELGALLFGGETPKPQPTAEPEPNGAASGDPTPPADPNPEPAGAGAEPQPQEPEPPEPQEPPQAAQPLDRISLRSLHPDDRLLIAQAKDLVRDGKAASIADAIMSLKPGPGTQQPAPAAQAPAEPNPAPAEPAAPVQQEDQSVARITQQIADLRAKRVTAVEEFDRNAEINLTSEIEDALAALAEAKSQAALQQREATTQEQAAQAVIEEIYVAHPEAEDPKSFFSYRMSQEIDEYEAAHGSISRHPQQLRAIAQKVATELGKGAPSPQPAAAPQPAVVPRQQARPLGTAAPGSAAAPRVTPDQVSKLLDSADADTLRTALFGS